MVQRSGFGMLARPLAWSALAVAALLGQAAPAHALTATSIYGGQTTGADTYIAAIDPAPSPAPAPSPSPFFVDRGDPLFHFHLMNLRAAQGNQAGVTPDPQHSEMLIFHLQTTPTTTTAAATNLAVGITATNNQTSVKYFIPIAAAFAYPSGSATDPTFDQLVTCDNNSCFNQSGNYYRMVNVASGQDIAVGFYPADLCFLLGGQNITGCSASVGSPSTATVPVTAAQTQNLLLSFTIYSFPNGYPTGQSFDPAGIPNGGTAGDNVQQTVHFQSGNLPISCTTADSYFPGDGVILVNTDHFNLAGNISGRASQDKLLVTGKVGAPPDTTTNFFNQNPLQSRQAFGGQQPFDGFTNTVDSPGVPYNVAFMVRDTTGTLSYINAADGTVCGLNGVETSEVRGFLSKSSCFIATAAFRSIDAAPVRLLREFRDRWLVRHSPGRAFVRWYYRWSPDAAVWLMENSEFRFPVLLALAPLQALAWLVLHRLVLGALAATALALIAASLLSRISRAGAR